MIGLVGQGAVLGVGKEENFIVDTAINHFQLLLNSIAKVITVLMNHVTEQIVHFMLVSCALTIEFHVLIVYKRYKSLPLLKKGF